MKELTLNETVCVSGGSGYRDWVGSVCSTEGSDYNGYSSPNDPCKDSTTAVSRTVCEVSRDAGKYHDNIVGSLADVMCRVTGTC